MFSSRNLSASLIFSVVLFIGVPAQALVTFGLDIGGATTVTVAPSTTVTVSVTLTNDGGGLLTGYAVSIDATGGGAPHSPANFAPIMFGFFPFGTPLCDGMTGCGSFLGISAIGAVLPAGA